MPSVFIFNKHEEAFRVIVDLVVFFDIFTSSYYNSVFFYLYLNYFSYYLIVFKRFTDIGIEKFRHKKQGSIFGRTFVNVSGDFGARTFVTNHTVHINFPDECGVRTLNLVYNPEHDKGVGFIPHRTLSGALPVGQRALEHSFIQRQTFAAHDSNLNPVHFTNTRVQPLLTTNKDSPIHAVPLRPTEVPVVLAEIREGKFDLIATAASPARPEATPARQGDAPSQSNTLSSVSVVQRSRPEVELLRLWRTGKTLLNVPTTTYLFISCYKLPLAYCSFVLCSKEADYR